MFIDWLRKIILGDRIMNLARKIEELEIEINRTKNRITNNNDAILHIIEKKLVDEFNLKLQEYYNRLSIKHSEMFYEKIEQKGMDIFVNKITKDISVNIADKIVNKLFKFANRE